MMRTRLKGNVTGCNVTGCNVTGTTVLAMMASVLLTLSAVSSAQAPASAAAASSPPASAQPNYHPSMGDLMTMAVQPRHIKLGLAGRQMNWAYAAYELSELRNAFGRVARTIPVYRTADTAAVIGAMTAESLKALDAAIRTGDRKQFAGAYSRLTAACNACHRSLGHDMVVIQELGSNAYPDQQFSAPKR